MNKTLLALMLSGLTIFGFSTAVSAAGSVKIKVAVDNSNPPVLAEQLPYTPAFVPDSGIASVVQAYTLNDWSYHVRYAYSNLLSRWLVYEYAAQRLRLPNGMLVKPTMLPPGPDQSENVDLGVAPQTKIPVCPQPDVTSAYPGGSPVVPQASPPECNPGPSTPPPDPTPPPPYPGSQDGQSDTVTIQNGGWSETTTYTWYFSGPTTGYWYLTYFKATKN